MSAPAAHPSPTASRSALRLRPGTPVVMRSGGAVQCGTDPRWALVLDGLSRAEASWLRDLTDRRHVTPARSAARRGVAPERRDLILDVLANAGMLVPPSPAGRTVVAPGDGTADARTLGMLRVDGAGLVTLADRAAATVALAGLGRIGAALALILSAAGVGHLVLRDPRPVQTTDVGLGAHTEHDVGEPRDVALARLLASRTPALDVRVDGDGEPDVAVVVESRAALPARFTRMMSAAVPHLSVVAREADVTVGPLVLPGRSACVGCLDALRADQDRDWHLVAAQLRQAPEQPHEAALTALAAATAACQVLAQLDGHRPAAVGTCLEIALPDCLPRVRRFDPHPRCGCLTLAP
ncbi:ThiF family adenylyltransferase [Myceligenerans pegani]|uniref:ThiF family adenylyltransferase n=1 Tax=Myceligenerans pegani TaxID=2776917 RepID=A0ABR9MUF1_9MICO|nr:ThiF family adenylyltransferase [Myceligenerans sp. TRM 65318]MBE1874691.1 ThiF family adenylyltransferase [Myceligenerans sp. TRM 65318]MBE3016962.1 ThiF family adenylyltransferase [Myceligenerans sp. TRM 65318]